VLRTIGYLELLDTLINLGFDEQWFPVEPRSLPTSLNSEIRARVATAQSLILAKSLDVEQGRHRHFTAGEPLPFEIRNRLGAGGYSQVDRIQSRVSSRSYALKRIRRRTVFGNDTKEAMKRFKAEVDIMRSLRYRHIVEFIGSYTDKTFLGIITAPVADMDLAIFLNTLCGCLENGSPSNKARANEMSSSLRSFFGCLAAALAYLHDNRVRHKDIKPQNILISQGTVLFTDFGLSRHFADAQGSTTSGLTAATPRYSPPEVAAYEQRNTSADVWSLGCVYLEMLAALKGHDMDWVKDYLLSQGTREPYYQSNPPACQLLLEKYMAEAVRSDRTPVRWVRNMIAFERHNRWTAAFLLQQITPGNDLEVSSTFCGICCMGDEESDSHDSLVDEPTIGSVSQRKLPVRSDPTIDSITPDPRWAADPEPAPSAWPGRSTWQGKTIDCQPNIRDDTTVKAPRGLLGVAIWDYTAYKEDEIDFKQGERMRIVDVFGNTASRWRGRNAAGKLGYFPAHYVKPLKPALGSTLEAIAIYDYGASEDNELGFPKGARIKDLVRNEQLSHNSHS
jgi:serine/threonine protein kinase